jgi:ABC-2 type transport system permease protein
VVFASARAQGFQDAYQTGGMVVLPVLLLGGPVIWLIDIGLLWLASRSFRQGELMTKF